LADAYNNRIRKVTPYGVVSTLAGSGKEGFADGTGKEAIFNTPAGIAIDDDGNIYTAEYKGHRIRKITPNGLVSTLAGSGKAGFADGIGENASFNNPEGVAVDSIGNVYVSDSSNNKIRKIAPNGNVTTLAGSGKKDFADGTGAEASFKSPTGIALDTAGNIYVGDKENHQIRKITPSGIVTTLAGSGKPGFQDGPATKACFNSPNGIAVNGLGHVFVADADNQRIRQITPDGIVTTVAGSGKAGSEDGYGSGASFHWPWGVVTDGGSTIYVSGHLCNKIRKISQY